MSNLETEEELNALHAGSVKESISLEYKASPAIDKKDSEKKVEMARDVSAFANADGGQIVYGMTEKDHEPDGLDSGVDPKMYPEIWFEQVLQQHVTPPISGLRIRHVALAASLLSSTSRPLKATRTKFQINATTGATTSTVSSWSTMKSVTPSGGR